MTPPPVGFSEVSSVESPAVEIFKALGWSHKDLMNETFGPSGDLARDDAGAVVIRSKLSAALRLINPKAEVRDLDDATDELMRDRSIQGRVQANREVYEMVADQFKATGKEHQIELCISTGLAQKETIFS